MSNKKTTENTSSVLEVNVKESLESLRELSAGIGTFNDNLSESVRVISSVIQSSSDLAHSVSDVYSAFNAAKILSTASKSGASSSDGLDVDKIEGIATGATGVAGAAVAGASASVGSVFAGVTAGVGAGLSIIGTITGIFTKRAEEEKKYYREINKALNAQVTAEVELSIATANRLADEQAITREKYRQIDASAQKVSSQRSTVESDIEGALSGAVDKLNGDYSKAYKRTEQDYYDALLALKNNSSDLDWLKTVGENPLMASSNEHYDQYKAYYNRLLALAQAEKDWAEQQKQLVDDIIGSSADDLAQSWVEAFQKGEEATWDFAQNFKDVMRQAVINGFSDAVILAQIEPIFTAFQKKIASYLSGEIDLEDVVTPELEAQITSTADKIKELSPELTKILEKLGLDVDASSSNTLSGAVKGVSEDTASLVAGQMNAIRSNQVKGFEIFSQSLLVLNKIESNTYYCRYLESIDRKVSSLSASSLRAQGL
ncbi:MAG: hypothetical protein PHD21_04205 [Flavobacteriales bacterium]|nr:hypothetical protein [Flavobacteriales bacterium]